MTNRLIQPPPKPALIAASPAAAATDGELLMRFSRHGDQEAFAEVVERHRTMIWGVCSRVLVRRADAEDAYQATLLILAKKSSAIRANDSAGGWLFRVAHNAALQALRRRKALRETPLDEAVLPPEAPFPDLEQKQLVVALLEELRAMPAKYQTPLVLRYLEGRSRREIAAATESTVATVAGQLVRGRRMLRSRLARRGVSLGLVLGAMGVGSTSHAAGTIHATPSAFNPVLLTTGASSAVTSLVNQGVRSMFYASVTKPVAVGLAASLVAAVLLVSSPEGEAQTGSEPGLQLGIAANETAVASEKSSRVKLAPNEEGNKSGGGGAPAREALGITRAVDRTPWATGASAETPSDSATQPITSKVDAVFVPADANTIRNAFEGQKERYAEMAAKESRTDYSQPSFEELYWHRNHWLNKQDALMSDMQALDRQTRRMAEAVAKGISNNEDYDRLQSDLLATRANLPLAKAKIAEYERLMKQAALRETRPQKNAALEPKRTNANRIDRNEYWQAPPQFQPPPTPLREAKLEGGTIQPGETLKIEIIDTLGETGFFTVPSGFGGRASVFSQNFWVDAEGQVALGALLGRVEVAGKTATEAEEAIRSAVERRLQMMHARKADQARRSGDKAPDDREFDIAVQVTRATSFDRSIERGLPYDRPQPNQGFGIDPGAMR